MRMRIRMIRIKIKIRIRYKLVDCCNSYKIRLYRKIISNGRY